MPRLDNLCLYPFYTSLTAKLECAGYIMSTRDINKNSEILTLLFYLSFLNIGDSKYSIRQRYLKIAQVL